jgi:hypothetical protein
MMSGMSDEYGYGAEVLAMTFRLATRSVAAEGITKGAGGYSRHLAAHAHAWMPLADALAGVDGGLARIGEQMDGNLARVQRLVDERDARWAARAQMPSQARAPEPQLMPVDLGETPLHASFGPPVAGPYINGFGAAAPDGGQ